MGAGIFFAGFAKAAPKSIATRSSLEMKDSGKFSDSGSVFLAQPRVGSSSTIAGPGGFCVSDGF